jgi:tricarballylate dehydrogenase
MSSSGFDVIVVGGGNAALCAALSARESGASVAVIERASEEERGGNSRFTAGAMRFAYAGLDDLKQVMTDLTPEEIERSDFGTYTVDQFYDDMGRITQYRSHPELTEILITRSLETMVWMRGKGVRFVPMWGRQAFKIGDKFRFWGGLTVEAWGGGPGLVESLYGIAAKNGISVFYGLRATELIYDGKAVQGIRVRDRDGNYRSMHAAAVVLACGGFESNAEWRTRYLGPGWDIAKVRGTRFNTGDGIRMALDIGAMPYGNWSGCHAVGWDMNAPEFGDLAVGDNFQKHSYPFGVMVNATGRRFVDEGADFRNYTYAAYGRRILEQPGQFCWQVFDRKVVHLLRDEYRIARVTRVKADTLEALAAKLEGVDGAAFLAEIAAYNKAVRTDIAFDPTVKDGRRTEGLAVPKSNWANTLDAPPFEAYGVTCGITFTFGGLRIDSACHVIDTDERPIPGLFAAGELVGGLFYFNYPGGTGLMSGSVFGRISGRSAGGYALQKHGAPLRSVGS